MKIRHLLFSLTFACTYANACGLQHSTDFNFITEPGSLDVFANVIQARQSSMLGNLDSQEEMSFISFQLALTKPNKNKLNFTIFESTKGHYSDVILNDSVLYPLAIDHRHTALNEGELLLISDIDVLDALARGAISWQQAKVQGLVKINGIALQTEQLDKWLNERFPHAHS